MLKNLKIITLVLTLVVTYQVSATDNKLSEKEKAEGWKLLFNGSDLSQWRNFKSETLNPKWKIQDDTMTLIEQGGGDILTKASYQNFELKLEWKISIAGNSGIFFLVDETGNAIYSHAPEIQILDNERHSDNKFDTHLSGALYDMMAPPVASHKPAGRWNQVAIRLVDSHLQVTQNGVVTVSIVVGSASWNTLVANSKFANWQGFAKAGSGHIGLQDHGDQVWFKNIKVKEL
jgi:hypothetical protein